MKELIHKVYLGAGYVFAAVCLCFWRVRDRLSPPQEEAILFVAHPDDDALFFHTFIKEKKPYVVLMTTAWSLRRLPCFFKAMRKYGVRYRAYAMKSRDTRIDRLEKHASECLALGAFSVCATHNADGEYGHEMHRRVHNAVLAVASGKEILVPERAERISQYPLDAKDIKEKEELFRSVYATERFVLEEYAVWVAHEKLIGEEKEC